MPKGPTLEELDEVAGSESSAADTIRAVMAESESSESTEETPEAEEASESKSDDVERDELGRFVSKEAEAAEGESEDAEFEEAAEPADDVEPADDEAEDDDEKAEPIDAPTDWTLEDQNAFRAIPDEHKQFVLDRFASATSGNAELEQLKAKYSALEDIVAPRRDAWAVNGMTEEVALKQLFALSDWASRDPVAFTRHFVSQRQIPADEIYDLSGLTQQSVVDTSDDSGEYADPDIRALRQTIAQQNKMIEDLKNTVTEVRTGFDDQQKSAEQKRQEEINNQVSAFEAEMDEKGQLKHPYFKQVQPLMGTLLQNQQAQDLNQAYEMACRAHPEVSAKIEAARKYAEQKRQSSEARRKSEAAKKAGSSVTGTPAGNSSGPPQTGDIREDMRAMFVEQGML